MQDSTRTGPAVPSPYGRSDRRKGEGAWGRERPRVWQGENYYGQPALKPGHYRWLIVGYFWLGGLAGAGQVLAVIADFVGHTEDRLLVAVGRWLALAGVVLGSGLLILDLHTPARFYNMLRIFRRTSAMSIGAWALAGFGTLSGLAVVAQLLEDFTRITWADELGRVIGVPAALLGAFIACYTATLLAATSVPFWAAVPRLLTALFGTSAMSVAAAALMLSAALASAPHAVIKRLEVIDLIAGGLELLLIIALDRSWKRQGVVAPIRQPLLGTVYLLGVVLIGLLAPLAVTGFLLATETSSPMATIMAALARLTGGFLLRTLVLFAGRQSALGPGDYFRFTQPADGQPQYQPVLPSEGAST